ncbi:MAG: hypothetical protein QGH37_34485, partial [Candidatus Poribacteria bacterium]|nr:hypothetical protein [Candidatus Poribacteria bacterium]
IPNRVEIDERPQEANSSTANRQRGNRSHNQEKLIEVRSYTMDDRKSKIGLAAPLSFLTTSFAG